MKMIVRIVWKTVLKRTVRFRVNETWYNRLKRNHYKRKLDGMPGGIPELSVVGADVKLVKSANFETL